VKLSELRQFVVVYYGFVWFKPCMAMHLSSALQPIAKHSQSFATRSFLLWFSGMSGYHLKTFEVLLSMELAIWLVVPTGSLDFHNFTSSSVWKVRRFRRSHSGIVLVCFPDRSYPVQAIKTSCCIYLTPISFFMSIQFAKMPKKKNAVKQK
jgi:hypothetical protein